MDDIKASFLFGYPDELVFKLYERQGRCFMSLGRAHEAEVCFEEALNKVNDSRLEDKKKETFIVETGKKIQEAKKTKSKHIHTLLRLIFIQKYPVPRIPRSPV